MKFPDKLKTPSYELDFTITQVYSLKHINHYQLTIHKINPLIKKQPGCRKFILKNIINNLKSYLESEYPIRAKRCEFFINLELKYNVLLALNTEIITLKVQKEGPIQPIDSSFINVKKKLSPIERGLRHELETFKKLNPVTGK